MQAIRTNVENLTRNKIKHSTDITALNNKCKNLEAQVIELKGEISKQELEIKHAQEYSRRNTLEITGIPETDEENIFELVRDVGAFYNVAIIINNLDNMHRIPTRSGIRPIIVRFANRWVCNRLKYERTGKKSGTMDIGFEINKPIYINTSLTKKQSYLAMKTRIKFKQFKEEGCRVHIDDNGSIWVKREGHKYKVTTEEDFPFILDKLNLD